MGTRRPAGRPWSEAETATLRRMVDEGCGHDELAAALPGRSRNALLCRVSKLGLSIDPVRAQQRRMARVGSYRPGPPKGRKLSPERHAKLAAMNRARWDQADESQRDAWRKRLRASFEKANAEGRVGPAVSAARRPDIPDHLMSDYRNLVRVKRYTRAEAIAMLNARAAFLRCNPELAHAENARLGSAELRARIQKLHQKEASACR